MQTYQRRYKNIQLFSLVLTTFWHFGQPQLVTADCYTECNFAAAIQPDASCQQLHATLACHDLRMDICMDDIAVGEVIGIVYQGIFNCELPTTSAQIPVTTESTVTAQTSVSTESTVTTQTSVSTESTVTTESGGSFQCPSPIPNLLDTGLPVAPTDFEVADISPEPNSCARTEAPASHRQCSMFTYSHMRPFKQYRTGLETCNVPGEWYLLKHPSLSVVVESRPAPGCNHTQLTKVNVTFSSCECSEEKSYVATIETPLPRTFTDGEAPNNTESALQLKHGGSVVSLMAVWINTTVIIRNFSSGLSVTLQVPGDVAFFSEGLCRGCPMHAYFNTSSYNANIGRHCDSANMNALVGCFFLANRNEFDSIVNDSYTDHCTYDIFKTGNIDTRTVMSSLAEDAKMLPDVGVVPPRIVPTHGPLPSSSPSSEVVMGTSTTNQARPESTTTAGAVQTDKDSSTLYVFPSSATKAYSLNLVTVIAITSLVALLLR